MVMLQRQKHVTCAQVVTSKAHTDSNAGTMALSMTVLSVELKESHRTEICGEGPSAAEPCEYLIPQHVIIGEAEKIINLSLREMASPSILS